MAALRLPDFLELAAIAHIAGGATDTASIKAAAATAWNKIKNISFLGDLAGDFGASATLKHFSTSADPAPKGTHTESHSAGVLEGQGLDQRHRIDKVIDARNAMEVESDPAKKTALKQIYDGLRDRDATALGGKAVEKNLPLEEYKNAVISQLGAELASGAVIETHVINHFIRLHAVHEDHVVIDDPSAPDAGRVRCAVADRDGIVRVRSAVVTGGGAGGERDYKIGESMQTAALCVRFTQGANCP